ncbi:MAG: glycoside hydrolase family 25 protein [Clostridia bacterium]|nr:glycoside hydrolase family 25 protein [Clostridia bacterium]
MKKGKIVILVIIALAVVVAIICGFNMLNKNTSKFSNESSKNIAKEEVATEEETLVTPEEIQIYDIEEGYLTVPYNKDAQKHEYNWDKYLKNNSGFYRYEDDKYKSRIGIDVSAYQGNIDWKKVKDAGVEFAILRLGYRGYGDAGNIVLDKKFEENYVNAKNEGIDIGVYFFSQAISIDEVKEEASFVLENLKGKNINCPVVFDLEKIKNDVARTDNLTIDEITNITLEFCKIIEENGYEASIYGNAKTFTTKMELELFNNYNKWYADYQEKPLYIYDFNIWQYTENGKINGISGNVDIDIQFVKK